MSALESLDDNNIYNVIPSRANRFDVAIAKNEASKANIKHNQTKSRFAALVTAEATYEK